jgi:hypothetical protein
MTISPFVIAYYEILTRRTSHWYGLIVRRVEYQLSKIRIVTKD